VQLTQRTRTLGMLLTDSSDSAQQNGITCD
jgi:hypothetical protein